MIIEPNFKQIPNEADIPVTPTEEIKKPQPENPFKSIFANGKTIIDLIPGIETAPLETIQGIITTLQNIKKGK